VLSVFGKLSSQKKKSFWQIKANKTIKLWIYKTWI